MSAPEVQPWYRLAPSSEAYAWDECRQVTRWLAYAQANLTAYDGLPCGDRRGVPLLQSAVNAFTCAALTRGWTPERAWDAACDGDTMIELIWEWLSNYGIIPSQVAPIEVPA